MYNNLITTKSPTLSISQALPITRTHIKGTIIAFSGKGGHNRRKRGQKLPRIDNFQNIRSFVHKILTFGHSVIARNPSRY